MNRVETSIILPEIAALSEIIAGRIGLDFPEHKWDVLQRVVNELAAKNNYADAGEFLRELLDASISEDHLYELIVRLTIGETYFLRDKGVFTVLREHILPELIAERASEKRLDIWCAASSTGEEPYSIAMLLDEKAEQLKDWQINLQASDLNPDVLEIARKGIYSNWSLRATPAEKKAKYFTEIEKNRFVLAPRLCKMVNFSQLNLATCDFTIPGFSGRLADIIFCRNVLIYFSAELRTQVIRRLTALLRPGGWLFVAPSELGVVDEANLDPVSFPEVIVHRKSSPANLKGKKKKSGPSHRVSGGLASRDFSATQPRQKSRSAAVKPKAAKVIKAKPGKKPLAPAAGPVPGGTALPRKRSPVAVPTAENILRQAKEYFTARNYREVVKLIPDDFDVSGRQEAEYAEIMALKARSLANSGEIQAAAAAIARALDADKVNPFYCYLSATIARELGDFAAALNFYRQVLFLEPDFIMAHFSIATLLKQLKRQAGLRHLRNVETLLESLAEDAEVPYSEGLTAGRLLELVRNLSSYVKKNQPAKKEKDGKR